MATSKHKWERDAPRGAPCISSCCSQPEQEEAEPGEGKLGLLVEKGALPVAIEPCPAAGMSQTRVTPCPTHPGACSIPAKLLLGTLLSPATSFPGASQLLGADSVWGGGDAAFPALVLVAPCCSRGEQAPCWHWGWHQRCPAAPGQLWKERSPCWHHLQPCLCYQSC